MKKNFVLGGRVVVLITAFLFISGVVSATAEPMAEPCKMNAAGIKAIKKSGKDPKKVQEKNIAKIPTKASWHLPVYPGAKFASQMKGNDSMFPSVNLVSDDPPEKVRAWYRDQLEGWTFDEMFKLFHEKSGKLDFGEMFTTQTVNILEETGEGIDLMFFDLPNVKSRIQIMYNPAKLN